MMLVVLSEADEVEAAAALALEDSFSDVGLDVGDGVGAPMPADEDML